MPDLGEVRTMPDAAKAVSKMIALADKQMCTGCCACMNVCPERCISMERDQEGFWYPRVAAATCSNCGLCRDACPLLERRPIPLERLKCPQVLAAWNADHAIRLDSTSGGVFSALAARMLRTGGHVAGAVFAADHTVSHVLTKDPQVLDALRSSKYLQSYTGRLFSDVRQLLEDGERVLFCGTPCQIAGLYQVLGKNHKNLVTCDFICRGVNSPRVFLMYVEMLEKKYGARATHIKFKDKTYGWHRFSTRVSFANGKAYVRNRYEDPFMLGYLKYNLFVRPSCYSCHFKGMPRHADISLADFWGIEKARPELDNDRGTSAVFLNSEEGREFFRDAADALSVHECTLQEVAAGNPELNQSLESMPGRERFFADMRDGMSFANLTSRHIPMPGRTRGIVGLPRAVAGTVRRTLSVGWRHMGLSPSAWLQFLYINAIRKNTRANVRSVGLLVPTRFCRFVIDGSARMILNRTLTLGWKRIRNSKLETRFSLGRNSTVVVNGSFEIYCGSDIWVFDGGVLTLDGGFCNEGVQITCAKRITLGKGCYVARDVIIRDYDAHQLVGTGHDIAREIRVGEHVWIGTRAIILPGVTIGDGAVVAAGAVVKRDVPPRCLVAGVPAKVVRENVEWR